MLPCICCSLQASNGVDGMHLGRKYVESSGFAEEWIRTACLQSGKLSLLLCVEASNARQGCSATSKLKVNHGAGLPAISVPCGFSEEDGVKLPLGLQIIGKAFDEATILQHAHIFQQTADFALGQPPIHS